MNFSCRDKIDISICYVFDKDLSDLDRCLHYYILKKLHDLSDLFFWDRRFCFAGNHAPVSIDNRKACCHDPSRMLDFAIGIRLSSRTRVSFYRTHLSLLDQDFERTA